jgi:hypothetical protein
MTVSVSYDPFERLIASLRNDGFVKEADHIHFLIHEVAWTTGSELIGELGQAIKKIKKHRLNALSSASKMNIRESMGMVKRVWPDFPG